jgi:hypothetical protein
VAGDAVRAAFSRTLRENHAIVRRPELVRDIREQFCDGLEVDARVRRAIDGITQAFASQAKAMKRFIIAVAQRALFFQTFGETNAQQVSYGILFGRDAWKYEVSRRLHA